MGTLLLVLAAGLAVAAFVFRRRSSWAARKGADGERRVAAELVRIGVPAVHDVYLRSKKVRRRSTTSLALAT
jgi:hypothetical protein